MKVRLIKRDLSAEEIERFEWLKVRFVKFELDDSNILNVEFINNMFVDDELIEGEVNPNTDSIKVKLLCDIFLGA